MDRFDAFTLSLHAISVASLLVFLFFTARYFLHMFQLNSYTAKVQWNWMRENKRRLTLHTL